MRISVEELERAAALGWRATEEERLGDWLLRAAAGFTGRANSALAAGDPGCPLPDALARVQLWYASRGLPAMIGVPYPAGQPAGSKLDRLLLRLGWPVRADPATVMVAPAAKVAERARDSGTLHRTAVEFAPEPDAAWLGRYHYRGHDLPPIAMRVLMSAPWQSFASITSGGETIAIGRVAGAGDWAGLTAIEVDPRCRGRGVGSAVTAALTARAAAAGYGRIYLQVTDDNTTARKLYQRLGFTDHHGYHYRVAPG